MAGQCQFQIGGSRAEEIREPDCHIRYPGSRHPDAQVFSQLLTPTAHVNAGPPANDVATGAVEREPGRSSRDMA